ncbi:APC family permease [Tessaracoccus flavus]|uniref:Transporter n=1 Tax=Tessaracoccus flavus TaxID=1610493 RepID=A0A1Q2CDT8_9ACTN|nr:APC family permease [Tessaracoccus flavus]AQP44251.1 transporter [Tessaracoccus flavus]SDY39577.1 amino acid/polyamine/organocation transporter, APC superfamily [Tessaracoccus flavus]
MARSELSRSLGLWDAVAIGVASMVGAGVFAVWGPAAQSAGSWLLLGLVIASTVAWANATSSAQLAAQYPAAGGTYVYGRERLGEWPGYLAGWSFVIGKTASCAAMALAFAAYVAPEGWQKPVAISVVWVLVGVNSLGVTRTAQAAKVLVTLSLTGIVLAVAFGWFAGPEVGRFAWAQPVGGAYGVLQSAGLLFFAFAGYARIATLGEEVRDPAQTIRRAIVGALTFVLALYAVVGVSLLALLGPEVLASQTAPLLLLVEGNPVLRIILTVGAGAAIAGALLGLLSGIGRTWLAMARERDLPGWFDHTHPVTKVPHRIEVTLGVLLTVILLLVDLRGAIGFSSFGVLLYYFVANVAAHSQDAAHRRYPKAWQVLGAALCFVLVVTLPWQSVLGGLLVLGLGVAWRALRPAALR